MRISGTSVRRGVAAAPIAVVLAAMAPQAHAALVFEGWFDPTPHNAAVEATIESFVAANEAELGVEIDKIGKWDLGGSFTPADPKFAGTLTGISCTNDKDGAANGVDDEDCTALSYDFDFSSLATGWQVVKVMIKGGNDWTGVWGIDPDDLLAPEDVTDLVSGVFSTAEYLELWKDVSGDDTPTGSQIKGISNITFFGTAGGVAVPEPGTLAVVGASLIGLGALRRRNRR